MEQYLETIHRIEREGGTASVSDIAEVMGVKAPSVTYVMQKLSQPEYGLVNYEKYNRAVSLTEKGRSIAMRLENIHSTLRWFFEMIGLDPQIADTDACEIEHFMHPETVAKLLEFVEWVRDEPEAGEMLLSFREAKYG